MVLRYFVAPESHDNSELLEFLLAKATHIELTEVHWRETLDASMVLSDDEIEKLSQGLTKGVEQDPKEFVENMQEPLDTDHPLVSMFTKLFEQAEKCKALGGKEDPKFCRVLESLRSDLVFLTPVSNDESPFRDRYLFVLSEKMKKKLRTLGLCFDHENLELYGFENPKFFVHKKPLAFRETHENSMWVELSNEEREIILDRGICLELQVGSVQDEKKR
ncbi:hypothetical protein GF342_05390 [Candidatus Woesearchaeota archaeon]|nr:hypothetical protein [Candidatus Woesearchaeota archaeon]